MANKLTNIINCLVSKVAGLQQQVSASLNVVHTSAEAYEAKTNDHLIVADSTDNAIEIFLPPAAKRQIIVKRVGSSGSNVKVTAAPGDNIDGAPDKDIVNDGGALILEGDEALSTYHIVAEYNA